MKEKSTAPKGKSADFTARPRAMTFAKEIRTRASSLKDDARERLFHKGMHLIYGGNAGSKAVARRP